MTAIALYLLKVMLCSGILFLYYHLALRNKAFHQWNRFYLLAAVALSLVLPFLQFRFTTDEENHIDAWQLLQMLQNADNELEAFVVVSAPAATPEQALLLGFCLICFLFFLRYILSFLQIRRIIRSHTVQKMDDIHFVETNVPGTPFSFFQYIFWNKDIPLGTATGQQIFEHERVHVAEKHSVDKLFLQAVLVFFWCNPFFWLIRKELYFIHEFIADQKAVENKDSAAFAAMILQVSFPQQFSSITNPFFQKSIKRRIAMLTKNQKPGLSYMGRMLALTLIASTVFGFTVRTDLALNIEPILKENANLKPILLQPGYDGPVSDTLPQKKTISAVDVKKNPGKKVSEITIIYTDGTKEKMTGEEARKKGLINNDGYKNVSTSKAKAVPQTGVQIRPAGEGKKQPLYILDGKEISKEELDQIEPNSIESVNVWKDESAIEKFGERGKNGVVEIISKNGPAETTLTIKENDKVTSTIKAEKIEVHSSGKITASGTAKGVIEPDSSGIKKKVSGQRKSAQQ
jgi:hypothetical protein